MSQRRMSQEGAAASDVHMSWIAPAAGMDMLLPCQNGTLQVGVAWEVTDKMDLDVSAVAFSATGTVIDAVYYKQLTAFGGALTHSGDCKTGDKVGFDEEISMNLNGLPGVSVVFFFLSAAKGGTFKNCESAMIEVRENGGSLSTFTCSGPASGNSTGLMMAMLYRHMDTQQWHLRKLLHPCSGRHFAACLQPIRAVVDQVLDPGCTGERMLSHDKTFTMTKGDQLMIPADVDELTAGLGWTALEGLDLDASCIFLDDIDNDGDLDPIDAVYFGQKSKQGVCSTGDNMSGEGAGDDEQIKFKLSQVPQSVTSLAIVVTIYSSGKSFSQVSNSYIRLMNSKTKHEYARMELGGDLKSNAVVFAILSRDIKDRNRWSMLSLGQEATGNTCKVIETDLWDGKWNGTAKYLPSSTPDNCCIVC